MKIAQIAPPFESVPPRLYGGTERVVSWLAEELLRRGHDVTLFASGDSRTRARLVPVTPRALRLAPRPLDPIAVLGVELGEMLERAHEFDVVHSHVGCIAVPFSRTCHAPLVHTLHGRLDLPSVRYVCARFPEAALVSLSDAQRAPLRDLTVTWAATVHHGLPLASMPVGNGGRYLAFLGRISPEKRPDLAIAIAKRVGLPLRIAAKVDPCDEAYFERDVKPLLDHPLIRFVGEIGEDDKPAFLGDALALLFPIDWPEPFGLVMIEAMACGTPVIARPRGSVAEVVVNGRTGFIAESLDALVDAVKRVDTLERAECRRHVERRFNITRMADDYEAVYRAIARDAARSKRRLAPAPAA